ncbi:TIGR03620 family F420-dependent LLM class oxidoreductase [Streptomyces sp. NPDC093085]|uniref:TIGR03620 family F420-dependent LLM class oxidoreductase n=1 Tax=Streptomyces sp. NPDC093085 TaxID=3155068 RepID=UPI00343D7122
MTSDGYTTSDGRTPSVRPAPAARFGPLGIWTPALTPRAPGGPGSAEAGEIAEALAEVDELGYGTLWLGGSPSVAEAGAVVAATSGVTVATGILSVRQYDAAAVAREVAGIERAAPGRFVLGLGVSHDALDPESAPRYARPYTAMAGYLDGLDAAPEPVPARNRVLAALGPRMLRLAAERTAGAHPYLITVEHTALARAELGPDALLAPEVGVVLDADLDRARETARDALARYLLLPNYTRNLLRLGFAEADFADGGSPRLLDALYALGGLDAVRARVEAHRAAGADHVALQVLTPGPAPALPRAEWRELATALIA